MTSKRQDGVASDSWVATPGAHSCLHSEALIVGSRQGSSQPEAHACLREQASVDDLGFIVVHPSAGDADQEDPVFLDLPPPSLIHYDRLSTA